MSMLLGLAGTILFYALILGVLFLLVKSAVKAGLREYFEEKDEREVS